MGQPPHYARRGKNRKFVRVAGPACNWTGLFLEIRAGTTIEAVKAQAESSSSPSAELWAGQRQQAWFCIRTHLKHEHIAAAHLRSIPGLEVFHAQLRLSRSTRRGRWWSTESLFPNYIFARFELESQLEKVSHTPGVKFVLRFGGRPPEVPAEVIENLRLELTDLKTQVITDAPVEGEEIEIHEGPFAGTKAVVAQVLPGKERARVLIDVLGRSVPAELSLQLVLSNRRNAAEIALKQAAERSVKQVESFPVAPNDLTFPPQWTGTATQPQLSS
jgi:transcriptional antiterminator RfaH